MATSLSAASHSSRPETGELWSRIAWCLLGAVLVGYGMMAFQSGTKISPLRTEGSEAAATVERIMQRAEQGQALYGDAETDEVIPFWINLISWLESSEYAHGDDSIMETEIHYYTMDESKRHVLGTHMMLGIVLMGTGFLQFWPGFRRKHRRVHRVAGVTYVLAALTSMSMSTYYLSHTPIEDVYSQFIFYAGLWALAVISIGSIGMAIWSIYRRNIAAHLGWQALAFGCFLTAPIQRFLWIGLSPFSNGASFNEVNILVNVALLPIAFTAGYALFYLNRAASRERHDLAMGSGLSPAGRMVLGLVIGVAIVASALFYLGGGLASTPVATHSGIPQVVAQHDAIASGPLAWGLFAVLAVGLISGARLLFIPAASAMASSRPLNLLLSSTALAALLLLVFAYQLGMPSHAHPVAGVGYALNGLLLLLFMVWALRHRAAQDAGKLREASWFLTLLLAGPGLLYAGTFLIEAMAIVPPEFAESGHAYQAAAGICLIVPILAGHLLAIHSGETRRHAIH